MLSSLSQELIRGAFTLFAVGGGAWFGAWLGLRMYFRQKEYELVQQRYLEGAIDIVAAEVEQALEIVRHNWARCLNIVKAYRDEKSDFDLDELSKGFRDLDIHFHRVPHHRIGVLVGSQLIWRVYQLAMAFTDNANAKIGKEIPDTIRLHHTTQRIDAEPEQIAAGLFAELFKLNGESHQFAHLTRVLYQIGTMLETERLGFEKVATFRERAKVKTLLDELAGEFAKDLAADDAEGPTVLDG